jgi:hypothetical protein
MSNFKALDPTVIGQSVYEESTTAKAELGAITKVGDRVYRYAVAGAALAAGDVVAIAANAQVVNATAGAAAVAGTREVVVYGAAAINASVFAEGDLIVSDATGQGYVYRIKSQPACSSAGNATVVLYDPLVAAIGVASEITLVPNRNQVTNVITATTPIQGVAACAVTSGNYFFAQEAGIAAVKVNTTVAFGSLIIPSTTGGTTVADVTANAQVIGVALAAGTSADTVPVLLRIK